MKHIFRFAVLSVLALFLLAGCRGTKTMGGNGVQPITFKEAFKDKFVIGVAINRKQAMVTNPKDDSLIKEQFNSLSPENDLKWQNIHPQADSYNFGPADAYVNYGTQNNMLVVGHTLVWHSQTPNWVFTDAAGKALNRDQLLQRLHDHISTVVGRYKGRIKGWDIVNEALNEDGTLRDSKWRSIIGDDYIQKAFEYAHEADPGAELYYNDYNLCKPGKRKGAVKIVNDLKAKGISITAVGEQGHYSLIFPEIAEVEATIKDFLNAGVHVNFTELDISVLPDKGSDNTADVGKTEKYEERLNPYTKALPAIVEQQLADRYGQIFTIFVKYEDKIDRVTFWGLTDGDSWLNDWPVRGRTNYPLPFDRDYKVKKPVQEAIFSATKR